MDERVPASCRIPASDGGLALTTVAERRYGELRHQLLGELQRNTHVSQRALARRLGVAVGTVNRLISDLMESGYVQVFNRSVRPFAYRVTGDGERFQRHLSHEVFSTAIANVRRLEERIRGTLADVQSRGVRRLVFYGAGTIMEITSRLARELGLDVIAVVDDNSEKHGTRRGGLLVQAPQAIDELRPDAVLITTLRHAETIQLKLDASLHSSIEVWEL